MKVRIIKLHSLILSLNEFESYIKGNSSRSLKKFMKSYDKRRPLLDRNFKHTKITNPAIIEHIKSILVSLNIPENQWDKYFLSNLTVYSFMQKLSREGYIQATYIVELIDKKTAIKTENIILFGLVALAVIGSFLLTPGVITLLQVILACAFTIPIASLVFSLITTAYYTYLNVVDHKRPVFNRVRDIFFDFAKSAFTIIGYGILFSSSAVMSPLVAGFFVLSSVLDVVKEVFCLIQETAQYKINKPLCDKDELNNERAYIRHRIAYRTHRNALIINLAAAVLFVGIMAVSSFIPGIFMLSIALTVSLVAVHVVKYIALRINEEVMRERLQKQLRMAENRHLQSEVPETSSVNDLSDSFTEDNSFGMGCKPSGNKTRPKSCPSPREHKTPVKDRFSFFSQQDNLPNFPVDNSFSEADSFVSTSPRVSG